MPKFVKIIITILPLFFTAFAYGSSERALLLQTTTSVYFTGIIQKLSAIYQQQSGQQIKIVSSGTGQALNNGRNGDADMVLVHAPALEQEFVQQGYGTKRYPLMANYFIFIGPKTDPAGLAQAPSVNAALHQIYAKGKKEEAIFFSRGDNSGTHFLEQSLWQKIGLNTQDFSSSWYRQTGQGMGATINIAASTGAYSISDIASWLKFTNKQQNKAFALKDTALYNLYSIIPVNPKKHSHVKYEKVMQFVHWLLAPKAQKIIAHYKIDGQYLYELVKQQ